MKPIRVGIVGLGWGELQIEAFRRVRGATVAAVCDADGARASEIAKRHKIAQTFADYRALIASPEIDLVSVATPPDSHSAMATEAIRAGKHLLVEKPLALNVAEARALCDAAEARGIVHAVDFEMRFLPALAYCQELIAEEYLGQLHRVDVTLTLEQPWGVRGDWAADDARGGGVLLEMGAHFLDILLWWFGDVRAVMATRRTHFPVVLLPPTHPEKSEPPVKRAVTADDAFWCVLQFARGGEALLNVVSGARHDPGWTISAVGSRGSLVVQSGGLLGMRDVDREMTILPIPKRLELNDNPTDPLLWSMAKLGERLIARIKNVPDARAVPDFSAGVAVLRVIDAIRRASAAREWVTL